MQKLKEILMQSEHNWCSEMAFTGFTKKYLELNPMNRNECGRPDDLVGLDEIAELKFDVKYFNHGSTLIGNWTNWTNLQKDNAAYAIMSATRLSF